MNTNSFAFPQNLAPAHSGVKSKASFPGLPFKWSALAFIGGFLLLLLLYPWASPNTQSGSTELIVSVIFISLLGIPHGAIDNVLYLKQHPQVSEKRFHLKYLLSIALTLSLWISFPVMGYIAFMLVSAFHFGESQFSHYALKPSRQKNTFQFFWGLSLLAGMTLYKLPEIGWATQTDASFQLFSGINNQWVAGTVLLVSGISAMAGLIYFVGARQMKWQDFLIECSLFFMIHLALYLFPLIIGFTLYFITLHSFKVLREEYQFLKGQANVENVRDFIKILFPFSAISILGIIGIYFLAQSGLFPQSFAYAFIILISCITVPHAHVMHRFYQEK